LIEEAGVWVEERDAMIAFLLRKGIFLPSVLPLIFRFFIVYLIITKIRD
jgi:hypothetical protein